MPKENETLENESSHVTNGDQELAARESAASAATTGRSTASARPRAVRPAGVAAVEPAATSRGLDGWVCEEFSGSGKGCMGYPVARAVTKNGIQVVLTGDHTEPLPESVMRFLMEGFK